MHLNCTLKLYHSGVMQQWINHFCKLQIMTASINSQGKKCFPLERKTVLLTPLLLGPRYGFCTYSPTFPSHPPKAGLLSPWEGFPGAVPGKTLWWVTPPQSSPFISPFFCLSIPPSPSFSFASVLSLSLSVPHSPPFCPLVSILCSYALYLFVP